MNSSINIDNNWKRKEYNHEQSEFIGNLKYISICQISTSTSFLITGGCSTITNEATEDWFWVEFPLSYCSKFSKINKSLIGSHKIVWQRRSKMKNKRYGHSSVYINGYILVFGGFIMSDSVDTEPLTITSCEKYHPKEELWTEAGSLNTPRAYSGFWKYLHFVYTFGGLKNYLTLDSFERYNSFIDVWEEITLR